jgi:hypothetical protein
MTSRVFEGTVGETRPAMLVSKHDYLIEPNRFPSEGNWAFCRFDGDEVPALRLGFQRGGFNWSPLECEPSPSYLQLHLELMTREGAILWLPSGMFPAENVVCDANEMNIRLEHGGQNIFTFSGWPTIECHFGSDDGDLRADLRFELSAVTTLPDCLLPHCLFAMWESMGQVSGAIRYLDKSFEVQGKVFFDHTRVIRCGHSEVPRHMYVYSTVYFDNGGGLFGYHSVDASGHLIDQCCYYVYLDAAGNGRFLDNPALSNLLLDRDGIAKSWQISGRTPDGLLTVHVDVQDTPIIRCWGSHDAPQTRKEFSIIPLVLRGCAHIAIDGDLRMHKAYGLAEYFNADLWPADKVAMHASIKPLP